MAPSAAPPPRRCAAVWHAAVAPTLNPRDTPHDLVRKRTLVAALFGCTAGALLGIMPYTTGRWEQSVQQYGAALWIFNAVLLYATLCVTKRAGTGFLAAFACAAFLTIVAMDVYQAAALLGLRSWPICVILLDILLLCDAPDWLTLAALAAMVLWVLVTQVEYLTRFGLFDVTGTPTTDQRRVVTECADPPCARMFGFAEGTIIALTVLIMDFTLTRGFKQQVRAQQLALQDSMAFAREVAHLLSEYDLDAAERYLETHGGCMPEGWRPIYGELLTNLRSYKPYLPHALFRASGGDGAGGTDGLIEAVDATSEFDDITDPWCNTSALSNTMRTTHTDSTSEPAAPTPPLVPLAKTPTALRLTRPQRDTMTRVRVDDKKISLLAATLDVHPDGAGDTYPRDHSTMLARAIDAIKASRGSVDAFQGERVYASFNAFSVGYSHAQNAVAAALGVCTAGAVAEGGACCAVVTGIARVGTLGTPTMLSPSIVGALPRTLNALREAGRVVGEAIVCNRACFIDACAEYPMRVLLHRVAPPHAPTGGNGDSDNLRRRSTLRSEHEIVYCVDRHLASAVKQRRSVDCQEWMYEVAAGDVWATYNEAGLLYHVEGADAAAARLRTSKVGVRKVRQFARDVEDAMVIDLRTRTAVVGVPIDTSWLREAEETAAGHEGQDREGQGGRGPAASLRLSFSGVQM